MLDISHLQPVCVYAEADSLSGPDTEDLLCDSTEYLSGAPPSGPHRPLLSAGGEELPGSCATVQKLRKKKTSEKFHYPGGVIATE